MSGGAAIRYAHRAMAVIIRAYGLLWLAEDVFWGNGSKRGRLLGVSARAKRGDPIDFSQQAGIYALYRGHEMVYVGQTGSGKQRLFRRLNKHRKDRLSGRWDRFSWFGLCYPMKSKLSTPNKRMRSALPVTLNQMEAILLAAAEPTLNRQGGRV